MNQIVASRSAQSACCQKTTVRSQRVGVRSDRESLADVLGIAPRRPGPRSASAISAEAPVTTTRTCEHDAVLEQPGKSKLGSDGSASRLGKHALGECPREQPERAGGVDDREHEVEADDVV